MKKIACYTLLFVLSVCISAQVHGQDTATLHRDLLGKWTMSKHLLKENGVLHDKVTPAFRASYVFRGNGTWSSTIWEKGEGSTIVVGKWKITADGKTVLLYHNRSLPPNEKDEIGDYPLPIIKLTGSEFVTNEYLFAEGQPGTSYYSKVNH